MNDKLFPFTVGLLAHVDAGKTTLGEALLSRCGVIRKIGRVDEGTTHLDTQNVERERGITVYSKQARLPYKDLMITILDTPGHSDFGAETERVLCVLDLAILLVSAPDGVDSYTRLLFSLLSNYNVPTFIFVNKCDRVDDLSHCLSDIKNNLSDSAVLFDDIFTPDNSKTFDEISLCDESLLNSYLENSLISDFEISSAVLRRKIFPVFLGSALRLDGVDKLLEGIRRFAPRKKYPNEFAARVFKITRENGVRLSHLKVLGGEIKVRDSIQTANSDEKFDEKINELRLYSGNTFESAKVVSAGSVCSVAGPIHTTAGDGLGSLLNEEPAYRKFQPMLLYNVTDSDPSTPTPVLLGEFKILDDEEPELSVNYDENIRKICISIMGEVQLEIIERQMFERFGRHIVFTDAGVLYKETIASPVLGCGHFEPLRHYAETHLIIEPLESGSGIVFESKLDVSVLSKNYQHQILSSLESRKLIGATGFPVTDVKITLVAGRAHEKHTEGGDFTEAAMRAFRQGITEARELGLTRILEPYYEAELIIPSRNLGRALNDFERMSGKVNSYETDGDIVRIFGVAPVTEIRSYQREVTSYSKGEGHLLLTPAEYFPCHNSDEVLSTVTYDPTADLSNPAGSIFCSHGAGFFVPWNEAKSHMHLPIETI